MLNFLSYYYSQVLRWLAKSDLWNHGVDARSQTGCLAVIFWLSIIRLFKDVICILIAKIISKSLWIFESLWR